MRTDSTAWGSTLLLVSLLFSSACFSKTAPAIDPAARVSVRIEGAQLLETIEGLVRAGSNRGREQFLLRRASKLGLACHIRKERIGYLRSHGNLIIDIPGKRPDLIYIVAHYDKADLRPDTFLDVLATNSYLEPLLSPTFFSQGAIDNGTGAAVVFSLAQQLLIEPRLLSYRVVLFGLEERGLWGSRSYVGRIDQKDWDRIRFVVNVDMAGVKGHANGISMKYTDPSLASRAMAIAEERDYMLEEFKLPFGVASDEWSFARSGFFHDLGRGLMFNFLWGLVPQRSWFGPGGGVPVISFDSTSITPLDVALGTIPLPIGSIHGPRDRIGMVDPVLLWEQFDLIRVFLDEEERRAAAEKGPS